MRMYAHELKALQTQVSLQEQRLKSSKEAFQKAKDNLVVATRDLEKTRTILADEEKKLRIVKEELSKYSAPAKQLIVTEHALLRYFERVLGYDLKKLSEMIASEPIRKASDMFPSGGTFPHDGFKVVVKDNTVVTVV